jgi:hypothetical protein
MPRIFDNIEQKLLPTLLQTLQVSERADFCVGYFNLRGWKQFDQAINDFAGGNGQCCRLLVGMQRLPQEDLQALFRLGSAEDEIDNATANRKRKELVEEFRNQLTVGTPTNDDEAGLRRLAAQIKAGKVVVKLFLAYPLHAKLYLLFRPDPVNPSVGFLGSSNLTMSGLSRQGELNIDVMDHDACNKLAHWFEDRSSSDFGNKVFEFEGKAVYIAAPLWLFSPHHLPNTTGGNDFPNTPPGSDRGPEKRFPSLDLAGHSSLIPTTQAAFLPFLLPDFPRDSLACGLARASAVSALAA